MKKRLLTFAAGLLALPLCCVSCTGAQTETGTEPLTTEAETVTEQITNEEEDSLYLIANPCRVDFSSFDEALFCISAA